MTKLKKRRTKKWNPEKRFNGLSREEYVRLPYKQFMSDETWKTLIDKLLGKEEEDEVEVLETGETTEDGMLVLQTEEDGTISQMEESG